ncbi:MAG: cold shock domain-containing protein [Cyanobacteria bacterium P01_F01_bin.116]
MVRRLIQRFVHWLRQLLTSTHGVKKSPQPVKPSRQLPPPVKPQTVRSSQSLSARQPQSFSNDTPENQPPRAPLNPASPRAVNPSRFKVLISDYEYSPSTAVQDLSHQLSNPETSKVTPHQQQSKTTLPVSFQDKASPTQNIHTADVQKPSDQSITLPHQQKSISYPTTNNTSQQSRNIIVSPEQSAVKERALSYVPSELSKTPTTATTADNSITKQGIVKLLFKLKKNNHHGYIAPEDGSKDIIFHKKFIGDTVFSQLERGMKVEVTAHITEGKAYADVVRIL